MYEQRTGGGPGGGPLALDWQVPQTQEQLIDRWPNPRNNWLAGAPTLGTTETIDWQVTQP